MNTSPLTKMLIVLPLCMPMSGKAHAEGGSASPPGRGELLYSTHCIACHTSEVHWRDKRLATDWSTLKGQVRRWALNSGQHWEESDVDAVAEYLNRMYYNFPDEHPPKTLSQRESNKAGAR